MALLTLDETDVGRFRQLPSDFLSADVNRLTFPGIRGVSKGTANRRGGDFPFWDEVSGKGGRGVVLIDNQFELRPCSFSWRSWPPETPG